MRPRINVTEDQLRTALIANDGDLEAAAFWLEAEWGLHVSSRTLRRRMSEMGIRRRVVRIVEEAA
ncbi:MAG: hypothetical protein IT345_15200 [Trueperaceae bacterium]|nr:hypothetical protein [Trueperaceae bacterium]